MLRLKEKLIEWQKVTAVMGVAANIVAWLVWWRGRAPFELAVVVAAVAVLAVIVALLRPRWFRGFYRGGMTISYHIGQTIGKVLLTVFFLAVTPMGLLLRLSGKDLSELKPKRDENSWWRAAKNNRRFDRMF